MVSGWSWRCRSQCSEPHLHLQASCASDHISVHGANHTFSDDNYLQGTNYILQQSVHCTTGTYASRTASTTASARPQPTHYNHAYSRVRHVPSGQADCSANLRRRGLRR
jgi:hypothetical protein